MSRVVPFPPRSGPRVAPPSLREPRGLAPWQEQLLPALLASLPPKGDAR